MNFYLGSIIYALFYRPELNYFIRLCIRYARATVDYLQKRRVRDPVTNILVISKMLVLPYRIYFVMHAIVGAGADFNSVTNYEDPVLINRLVY